MLKPKFHSYSKLSDQGPYLFSAMRQLVFRENKYYLFLGVRVSRKTLVSLCWEQNRDLDAVRFCLDRYG